MSTGNVAVSPAIRSLTVSVFVGRGAFRVIDARPDAPAVPLPIFSYPTNF